MDPGFKWRTLPLSARLIRDFYYFLLLILIFACKGLESHNKELENYLLCKFCGADVADLSYVVAVDSPISLKTENQTLSDKEVVVQTFKNPFNVHFDVITVKKSGCVGYGQWSKSGSWFPGYSWKVCICPQWGHFLGWIFEPHESVKEDSKKASEKGFYALILENILTEQFSNSLLVIPKSFSS